MTTYHLAQINIARMRAPLDDPLMAGFVARLDEINALADEAPGFVWRLQDESNNATNIKVFDDPRLIVNMSVWESIEALFEYTYRSGHIELLRARKEWFEPPGSPPVALWWIPAGQIPTAEEGKQRLALLEQNGPSAEAFTFKQKFEPGPPT